MQDVIYMVSDILYDTVNVSIIKVIYGRMHEDTVIFNFNDRFVRIMFSFYITSLFSI
jgi:hypothetical protein